MSGVTTTLFSKGGRGKMNGVYRLYFVNDTRCYIGSSVNLNSRLRTHIIELLMNTHSNTLLQKAFNKHGYINYRWEILESNLSKKELLKVEYKYIKLYKSNTTGFNRTVCTSSGSKTKNTYVPNDAKTNDDTDIVKYFLKNFNITFEPILISTNENIIDRNNYSKVWWNKQTDEDVIKFSKNMYNFITNIKKKRLIDTMMVCGGKDKLLALNYQSKVYELICSMVKKFEKQPWENRAMKNIIFSTALNPFHMEMAHMTQDEINKFRLNSLFKILVDCHLDKNISIYVPQLYFESLNKILQDIKKEIENENKNDI